MSGIRFTIITVCFNAADTIKETIESVLSQSFDNYEYIIKDGSSKDDTVAIAKEVIKNILDSDSGFDSDSNKIRIEISKDAGIYDAMNQAVAGAKGEYILFLNSGDLFASEDVLSRVDTFLHKNPETDIAYGDVYEISEEGQVLRHFEDKNSKAWYYALGACLNHQTMFCRNELFENRPFDLAFKVNADRDWQMEHIIKNKKIAKSMGFPVASYLRGGFSEVNVSILEYETKICVKKYCGIFYILYWCISLVKKSEFLHKLLTAFEARLNTKSNS